VSGGVKKGKAKIEVTDKFKREQNRKQVATGGVDLKTSTDGTDCIHTHACVYKIHTQNLAYLVM
jgi:hypothetical protein